MPNHLDNPPGFRGSQVIVINASEYGVDALIFGATGPIQHVSLPDVDLEIITELSNDIVLSDLSMVQMLSDGAIPPII